MTELEFLNETINHYNSTNRAISYSGKCIYSATDTSEGCAIGRFLDPLLFEDSICYRNGGSITELYSKKLDCLPKWMQIMRVGFLQKVQGLHDTEYFWNEDGLTQKGLDQVEKIKARFSL